MKLTMVILLANSPCSRIKYGSVKVRADIENHACFVMNRMMFYSIGIIITPEIYFILIVNLGITPDSK